MMKDKRSGGANDTCSGSRWRAGNRQDDIGAEAIAFGLVMTMSVNTFRILIEKGGDSNGHQDSFRKVGSPAHP